MRRSVNILVQRSFRGRFFPAVPVFPAVPTFPVILAFRSFRLSGPSSFLEFLVKSAGGSGRCKQKKV
jgi:hypothetical protein